MELITKKLIIMKKSLFFVLILTLSSAKLFSQDFSDPLEYLNFIDQKQHAIAEDMWTYISTSAHSNRDRKITRKKTDLLQTINDAKLEVRRMPAYNGSTDLRDSMVAYLDFSAKLLTAELTEMEALEFDAKKSYKAMQAYLDKVKEVNNKFSIHGEILSNEYEKFAALNDIQITANSSKLSANIKIANIVNEYYNSVYLIYFKAALAEGFINQAINDKDTAQINIWMDSLLAAVNEGNTKLKSVQRYNGDLSLKFACQKAMNNYKLEVNTYLPKILDFYDAETELNKVKANYNSKPQNQITQADVDDYNKAVENYNNAIGTYNQYTEKITELQQDNFKQWKDSADKFIDKNIPK